MTFYAKTCGWTLARAHARSGDPVAIAKYLGKNDTFDRAVADFAKHYARQNDRDFEAFADAVRTGRIEAASERPGRIDGRPGAVAAPGQMNSSWAPSVFSMKSEALMMSSTSS